MFFKSLGKLLYNLAPRKAKDLWPVLRREKGTLRSQEFRVTLLCILDRRTEVSQFDQFTTERIRIKTFHWLSVVFASFARAS